MPGSWMRKLGRTGLQVSALGLGTVKLGRDRAVKYPRPFQIPDDAAAAALLHRALGLGINLLDTAPAYGTAEERLGRLLASGRDRWVIGTKAGEEFDAATGESRYDFSPGAISASLDRSLQRLRTDRVEIVLLHSDGRDAWIIEESGALGALEAAKARGKVRAIGISTKTPLGAHAAIHTGRFDVVMLTLNPRERDDLPALHAAHARGIGVLIKKPLAGGHASAAESLRFVLGEPGVSAAIVGTIDPAHLEANVKAASEALEA